MFIDLDSGTVLNGPIFRVDIPEEDIDAVMDNDQAARDYALAYGEEV